jgi:hypothetical protein
MSSVGIIFKNEKTDLNYMFFKNSDDLKMYTPGKIYEIYIGGKFNLDLLLNCQNRTLNCEFVDSATGSVISIINLAMIVIGGGLIIYSLK